MGFEIFVPSDLRGTFSEINKNLNEKSKQKLYHDNWIRKYDNIFYNNGSSVVIEWDIRLQKSLKEMMVSSTFYFEAQYALQNNLYSSYYYLMYYSLFHAMLSSLFLDDKESIDNLMNIHHSKIPNCFANNFCNNKFPIISVDIKKHFEILRFMREYSSYSMPMNEFFMDDSNEIENPQNYVLGYLKQIFQITNLHAIILTKSCRKHGSFVKINSSNIGYLSEIFYKVNGKRHPFSGQYLIDPQDKNTFIELRKYGCKIQGLTIDLEHFYDEYHGYSYKDPLNNDNRDNYHSIGSKAFSLVYNSLID